MSPRNPQPPRRFFRRDPRTVAQALLGQKLVRIHRRRRLAGLIVETEAYLGKVDQAAHTYQGRRTPRNESMWRDGGHAYVYFTYGMHHCLNVVASHVEDPVAVLIRALEPIDGRKWMYTRRPTARNDTDLCSGPAKLCQAMAIDRQLDGIDLLADQRLFIERRPSRCCPPSHIAAAPRIGVAYAGPWAEKLLRYYVRDNPHVSKP